MTSWKEKLKALHPCLEAYRWAIKHKTLREAWRMCERRDWMIWLFDACTRTNFYRGSLYNCVGVPGRIDNTPTDEQRLQDAYIILDFMPDPPTLPDV